MPDLSALEFARIARGYSADSPCRLTCVNGPIRVSALIRVLSAQVSALSARGLEDPEWWITAAADDNTSNQEN